MSVASRDRIIRWLRKPSVTILLVVLLVGFWLSWAAVREARLVQATAEANRLCRTLREEGVCPSADMPKDPWGVTYRCTQLTDGGVAITSLGPDRRPGGTGDGADIACRSNDTTCLCDDD
jgi:hypothetical protein